MKPRLQPRIDKQNVYDKIRPLAGSSANGEWLAQIVASWCAGEGVLPDYLGLEPAQFKCLTESFFPGCDLPDNAASGSHIDFSRMLEKDDLVKLLQASADPAIDEIDAIIGIVVAACLGDDHLWQDLGLWSRAELSALLLHNFPPLAAKNTHDMKWKKFLYKQLCEAEGLYVCRAPSCDVCTDYRNCFGPEN
ncbi:MAG: nitrogen fixation protein NifQ [Gammaproteobacteria bacterium]